MHSTKPYQMSSKPDLIQSVFKNFKTCFSPSLHYDLDTHEMFLFQTVILSVFLNKQKRWHFIKILKIYHHITCMKYAGAVWSNEERY